MVIPEGDELGLTIALTKQPVSVGIYASTKFQFYSSGTFVQKKCTQRADHAVLLVGYGTDERGQDYYILKNSWGNSWGLCSILSVNLY